MTDLQTSTDLDQVADRVLAALAGPGAMLRDDQRTAVEALTRPGARALVVQATGWGKSAVYWVATALSRARGGGPTLVVSPLLSLMRDQVAAAGRAGLRAATINSSNIGDWSAIEDDLRSGRLDVLLVSPERLANPSFGQRVLDGLAGRLGLLVIDEAHAVSDWGHDFRPDYRRVSDVLQQLNPDTPVLATTATANARVTDDLAAQLGEQTTVLRGPLARSSLQLTVLPRMDPLSRYAWVVEHLPSLPGAGIVYTLTVADAHRLTEAIRARHGDDPALQVAAYTGQLEAGERERLEEALRANEVKALVATSALGMGYDKPDLGFVVHVGAPPSPVSYYQQVGRAGRAIDHAAVVLLPSAGDDGVWDYFATATIPKPDRVEKLLAALDQHDEPVSVPALEAETGLRRTAVELMLKQLAVDGVTDRTKDGWVRTGAEWSYDQEHYDGVLATRRREADIMRRYVVGESCLMQLLQESLDDPDAAPCGRCSVCLGHLPEPLQAEASDDVVAGVRRVLRTETHVLERRKMWPGGAFGARGRIPAELSADDGRVIVHADAPEWAQERETVLAQDGSPTDDLLEAAVGTLARWKDDWAERPEVVLPLAASGLPEVVSGVAAHLSQVGRLDLAPLWQPATRVDPDLPSSDEAAGWRESLDAGPVADQVRGRSVLLVVDATRSGWAATVAAATLREAGARRVLPLVVHRVV
ncbi:ATP-dependent DNA helicase RecQ [Barrientosiimonas humi]|uniref:DNA 3'-5' helicase n=1 Tax=Barrientosiimonas humi TaxID=999931 RepID=A0A542XB59_9MICO|nr:DEAD/DEAH box helicase [Barrientosiimonas humi]TQL33014.1 ATP-dependent DNA helicase RecQ [Barrientosiimonas humi]CAG7573004.1 ATP-dependent DNA helicase RecQ [Barrientosiimonas humi]